MKMTRKVTSKLTDKVVESLKLPKNNKKFIEYGFSHYEGLKAKVYKSGTISFRYLYFSKVTNKTSQMKIGRYTSAQDVLALWHQYNQLTLMGKDPALEKKSNIKHNQDLPTLDEVVEQWVELYAKKNNNHWFDREAQYKNHVKDHLGFRKMETITALEVMEIVNNVQGKETPSKVFALCKQIWKWAFSHELINENPMARLSHKDAPRKAKSRNRVLTDEEIKSIWWGFEEKATATNYKSIDSMTHHVIRILLLSPQRIGELRNALWSDIDYDKALWSITETKNSDPLLVPLSQACMNEFKALQKITGHQDKVLNNVSRNWLSQLFNRHYSDFTDEPFTPHDLRRTARTILGDLNVDRDVAEALLGHRTRGVVRVYDRSHKLDKKRNAVELLAAHIMKAIKDDDPEAEFLPSENKVYGDIQMRDLQTFEKTITEDLIQWTGTDHFFYDSEEIQLPKVTGSGINVIPYTEQMRDIAEKNHKAFIALDLLYEIRQFLKAKASGNYYIQLDPENLAFYKAMLNIKDGFRYYCTIKDMIKEDYSNKGTGNLALMTPMFEKGMSNKEIADELNVSPNDVSTYRKRWKEYQSPKDSQWFHENKWRSLN